MNTGTLWSVEKNSREVFRLTAGEGLIEYNITVIIHRKLACPKLCLSSNGGVLVLPFLVVILKAHRIDPFRE